MKNEVIHWVTEWCAVLNIANQVDQLAMQWILVTLCMAVKCNKGAEIQHSQQNYSYDN